jgi:hypothetical protein
LEIKKRQKWWVGYNKPIKQKIDVVKKEAIDREREIAEPWERAEKEYLKPAMLKFDMEEQAKRKKEQDRLEAEARKRQEDEQLAQAAELEAEGKTQEAQAVVEQPTVIPSFNIPDPNKTKGISSQKNWKFEVINPKLVPDMYKIVDEKAVRKVVTALKEKASIPGVRIYAIQEMSAGGRG